MAAILGKRVTNEDGSVTITWSTVTTSDTGAAVSIGDIQDPIIHVVGTGTAQLQGSNDGAAYVSIGSALVANSLNQMTVFPKYIQFSVIASATVTIVLHGKRRT